EEEDDYADEELLEEEDDYVAEEFIEEEEYYADEEFVEEEEYYAGEDIQILDMNRSLEDEDESGLSHLLKRGQSRVFFGTTLLLLVIFASAAAAMITGKGGNSVEAFSSVSSTLEDVDVIGEEGLSALMESKSSAYQATLLSTTQTESGGTEYEETEESNLIYVELVMTSVEKDLKIKFTNAGTGKLIANVPFSVKVIDSNQKESTWTDEDKDGIIYMSGLVSGTYRVTMMELEGELYERYTFSTVSESVTVKDTIVYETVDVSAEIKEEAEINVAEEEAQVELEVESVRTNTVDWVESTKTLSAEGYTEIDKSQIEVPTAMSVARSFLATAQTNEEASDTGSDTGTDDSDDSDSEDDTGDDSSSEDNTGDDSSSGDDTGDDSSSG
ncbi:MAG: hypothetical protein LUH19_01105, partial [Lachnospiraceae bacterium]|nr:hypothetical protein [Lachnospiraceae bacterium]